jgi:copper transport protein
MLLLGVTLGLVLAMGVLIFHIPTAAAHAKYTSSDPAANSTVTHAPGVVTVHFAEDVNPVGSDLLVYDTKGKIVSTAAGKVEASDAKTMTVPMTGDDSESYMVVWHTVSLDDGDPAVGAFIFNVGTVAKPGDSGGSTTSSGAPRTTATASGVPGWVAALTGVLGLVVGGVGGTIVARQRLMKAL